MKAPSAYFTRDVRKGVGLLVGPDRHGVLLVIGHVAFDPGSRSSAVWYRPATHTDVRRAYPAPRGTR